MDAKRCKTEAKKVKQRCGIQSLVRSDVVVVYVVVVVVVAQETQETVSFLRAVWTYQGPLVIGNH